MHEAVDSMVDSMIVSCTQSIQQLGLHETAAEVEQMVSQIGTVNYFNFILFFVKNSL